MTWIQRLKRVFNIDMEVCERCGSQVKVIASIEDPAVIAHILKHLKHKAASARPTNLPIQPPERGPPQARLTILAHKLGPQALGDLTKR